MKYKKTLITFLLFILFYILFISPFLINSWGYIIDKNYHIPKESNLFIFNATVMQNGSSDAWIYGEDYNNYYYNGGLKSKDIISISKKKIKNCPDFNSVNISSWCGVKSTTE
jgi:hypothetical protein